MLMMRFALHATIAMPALCGHIVQIHFLRACKEVGRVDTGAIVAGMTSILAFFQSAKMKLVTKPMRVDQLATIIQDAISVAFGTLPLPTVGERASGDILPKTLFRRLAWVLGIMPSKESIAASDRLAASTFAEFWSVFMCVHRCNFSTFYTCNGWQKADSL